MRATKLPIPSNIKPGCENQTLAVSYIEKTKEKRGNGMKYLIVGTGGTGGSIGGYLAADGRDVSFIARGTNREAMKERSMPAFHIRRPHHATCL